MVELATQTRDVEALLPALAFHARANRRIQDAGAQTSDVLAVVTERGALAAGIARSLAFYRQVGAAGYLREADALVTASA
jgi:hypothetical protein